jgi:uracil-DNA glycosylase
VDTLLREIRECRACESHLPLGARPIVQAQASARLLIVSQAPGLSVHQTGIPWNDASGVRLRHWLGITPSNFYDPKKVALVPMGFCYPGRASSGDAPPRRECFPLWHSRIASHLKKVRLTLLVGSYAQAQYLKGFEKSSMTETIRSWREYLPDYLPLPHPSPRNNVWLKKNPWFENEVVAELREIVSVLLR